MLLTMTTPILSKHGCFTVQSKVWSWIVLYYVLGRGHPPHCTAPPISHYLTDGVKKGLQARQRHKATNGLLQAPGCCISRLGAASGLLLQCCVCCCCSGTDIVNVCQRLFKQHRQQEQLLW